MEAKAGEQARARKSKTPLRLGQLPALTELSAAETQTQGPYTFRNARLELFQTGIGSTGLRYCCRKFCKNDEDKIMTKTSSTLHSYSYTTVRYDCR